MTTAMGRNWMAIAALAAMANAQTTLDWSAEVDGFTHDDDVGTAIATASDGSVYVGAQVSSFTPFGVPQTDGMLTRFSSTGAVLWTTNWDEYGFGDYVQDVAVDSAGAVFVSGQAYDALNYDASLRKYASDGTWQWTSFVTVGGANSAYFRKLAFLSNGDIVAAGARGAGGLVACFDTNGVQRWSITVAGGLGGTRFADIAVTPQDEILVCGSRGTAFNGAMTLIKYDANGVEQWLTMVDDTVVQQSAGLAMALDGAGKLVASGLRRAGGLDDSMLAQVDIATGAVDWTLYVDGGGDGFDELRDVSYAPAGTLWAAGRVRDASGLLHTQVALVSRSGALLSHSVWNGIAGVSNQAQRLHVGSAGQAWVVAMIGDSARDIALLQFDSSGVLASESLIGQALGSDDIGFTSELGPGGKLVIGGSTDATTAGDYDAAVWRLDLNDAPTGYCTAKVNSLGCVPSIGFVGASSMGATSGFSIVTTNVRNQRNGMLIYSVTGPGGAPFQGGHLCVQTPLRRTLAQSSGGSVGGDDCTGVHSFDMNAFASGTLGGSPAPELSAVGRTIHCQQWSRDPGAIAGSSLSGGLRYVVQP